MTPGNEDIFGPVIFRYTRKQAIEDGVLVDLASWAAETGFTIPVACTAAVWNQYVTPPNGTEELGQSERGRGHDLLWMLYVAIRRNSAHGEGGDRILYDVIFLSAQHEHETVKLKAICGPGDNGEPVLTIMLPHED